MSPTAWGTFHLVRTSPPPFSIHQGYQDSANIHPGIPQGWLGTPGGESEDGGVANQPVILKGGVGQ